MGNLLGSPVTEKDTLTGSTQDGLHFAVSSMQGWRIHMEDAHICEPSLHAQAPSRTEDVPIIRLPLADHSLFAVFDGHGGSFAAEYASKNLCRVLSRQPKFIAYAKFAQERRQKEAGMSNATEKAKYVRSGLEMLEGSLRDTFIDLDREILLAVKGSQVPEANTMYNEVLHPSADTNGHVKASDPIVNEDEDAGTTAVVVIVTPQWIVCANAGDSRAVFSKQGNKAVPLSYDHKPDDDEETRRIQAAGGYVAGGRVLGDLAVSRGLGDFRFKEESTVLAGAAHFKEGEGETTNDKMMRPDDQKVSPVPDVIIQNRNVEHDEFLMICCDGIWDVRSNYEGTKTVADIFSDGESDLGLVCEELLDLCLKLGSKDNMTALVVRFPAQKIGDGDGVAGRRAARQLAESILPSEGTEKQPTNSN